jgi:hypothetical protein
MAGPAGFEPAAPGFGDRCSAVRATDLQFFYLLHFFMYGMFSTMRAVFFKF